MVLVGLLRDTDERGCRRDIWQARVPAVPCMRVIHPEIALARSDPLRQSHTPLQPFKYHLNLNVHFGFIHDRSIAIS
jgi:hypothetical protein